jgi:hypothetical protein
VEFDELFYVEMIEPKRIPKQLIEYTPRETRFIRRPKLRWKIQLMLQRKATVRKVQTFTLLEVVAVPLKQYCNGFNQRVARQQLCKHDPTRNNRGGCVFRIRGDIRSGG